MLGGGILMSTNRARLDNRIRNTIALLILATGGLFGIDAASAYFAAHGSGTASATAAPVKPLTVTATGTVGSLLPGGTVDLHLSIDNPNSFAVKVTGVTQTPSSSIGVTGGLGTGLGTCTNANAAVTTSATQSSLPLTIGAGGQTVTLAGGASMAAGSANGCQQASFSIPVTLSVQIP
jgi:hypothetical protein